LLPTVQIGVRGEDLLLQQGEDLIVLERLGRPAAEALRAWDGTRTEAQLIEQSSLTPVLVAVLDKLGWVVRLRCPLSAISARMPWISRQVSYWAHLNQLYPDDTVSDLSQRRVTIAGMGGVGSHVAFSLCASGVSELTLVDRDCVEPSNLNRQFLYSAKDVGRPKVSAAATALASRFPTTKVFPVFDDLDAGNNFEVFDRDLLVICGEYGIHLDNPSIVGKTPVLLGGYHGRHGVLGPLVSKPHGTSCWCCFVAHHAIGSSRALVAETRPALHGFNSSSSTINGIVGSWLAEAAVRSMTRAAGKECLLEQRVRVDMLNWQVTSYDMSAPSCRCFE